MCHRPSRHVVGSGPMQAKLSPFGADDENFKLVLHGDLPPAELRKLLVERVDLVTAMGTAALEGAALGLPVMLLDLACAEVLVNYQFRWLFSAKDYELGHMITAADCNPDADTFPAMLADLDRDYASLAARSFAYVREHHSLDAVVARFLNLTASAELRYGDVPANVWRKGLIRRGYERLRY